MTRGCAAQMRSGRQSSQTLLLILNRLLLLNGLVVGLDQRFLEFDDLSLQTAGLLSGKQLTEVDSTTEVDGMG